jgi:DNA-dependent metalloprotease WSS1
MNHSAAFHTLRRQLFAEVTALQRKGYYGDGESHHLSALLAPTHRSLSGYWSAGTRLVDSRSVAGDIQTVQGLPEYTVSIPKIGLEHSTP